MIYENEIIDRIKESEQIVIYGARIVASEVATCLTQEPYKKNISYFVVSDMKGNPSELLGRPVITVNEARNKCPHSLMLIAVLEKYMDEIIETLEQYGFTNFIPLGFESGEWEEIRGNYFYNYITKLGKQYLTLDGELDKCIASDKVDGNAVSVYMAKCHVDRKITADFSKYDWEIPIQVGAELTSQRICGICDNTGDNISLKNREYCELTALYWIWKNDRSDYAGLCHYRRHFKLDRERLNKLASSDIDVILTIPILNFPNVKATYYNDHVGRDWEIMMDAVREIHPDYYETADAVQNGIYYYAYNMFVARKCIFDSYCEWLFPILDYCENKCVTKNDTYQNRYIGFLAERLLSIYFIHNEDKYKIVLVEKEFFDR